MTLSTGTATPTGQIITGEGIYIEGGPEVYFQSYDAGEANTPDSNGLYWGLSGTVTYPVYQIECYDNLQMIDDVAEKMITCQNLGEVDALQRRNHLQLTFTLKSLLPFDVLSRVLRGGAVTVDAGDGTEGFGLGEIRSLFYHIFFSRIYDQDTGDFLSVTFHKAKFTEASPLSTPYADAWSIPVKMTAFADNTKPRDQRFGTVLRLDPSQIP